MFGRTLSTCCLLILIAGFTSGGLISKLFESKEQLAIEKHRLSRELLDHLKHPETNVNVGVKVDHVDVGVNVSKKDHETETKKGELQKREASGLVYANVVVPAASVYVGTPYYHHQNVHYVHAPGYYKKPGAVNVDVGVGSLVGVGVGVFGK